jgi:hypothetical protein
MEACRKDMLITTGPAATAAAGMDISPTIAV